MCVCVFVCVCVCVCVCEVNKASLIARQGGHVDCICVLVWGEIKHCLRDCTVFFF
jgi:hypothetical protein